MKTYEESKKAYDKQLFTWQKALAHWDYKTTNLKKERLPYLEWKIEVQRASLNSWAYFYYLVKMLGLVLMGFGCTVFLLLGSDSERAAAIFILGFVLLQLV